jgi:transcriptional regulator with XRE-family HTH domain
MAGDEPNAFGREVRRRRLAQGLTLDALSAVADLTANYIGSIEAGQLRRSRWSLPRLQ